ncbi:hypothetical protein DL766_006225 [Monosporascus sp. MC13-8B]|nr:hypothetical protein DL763_010335 [Monosporascus cannonballus]RYP27781.1 hypothetical protein DL766_006225 [Monosporascus sp. MC13-8B]
MAFFLNIKRFHRHNVDTIRRSPLAEISGALGDLGTLLPLMITLAVDGSISLSTTLVFSGFFNFATGVIFGIPLPVQPMKAIAAAAIASRASQRETVAAGSVVSIIVFVLSVTGLLHWVARVIPVPVIKGIQFGAGLSLVISAGSSLLQPLAWLYPFDNRIWAFAAFVALIATQKLPRFPYALIVFLVGLALAVTTIVVDDDDTDRYLPSFGLWQPRFELPNWSRDAIGMGIAQLPLTTLNSVIAASALAADLLPQLPTPSVAQLGTSVAAMNLLGCWFGAMPVCHGAGGLAAQYRFGARSGASVMLLGLLKVALGLALDGNGEGSLLGLLRAFPRSLLGVMVIAAGLELAAVGRSLNHGASDLWESSAESCSGKRHRVVSDEERSERWTVMLMTTGGILAFKNTAVGFGAGLLCHWAYAITGSIGRRRAGGLGERAALLNR